KLQKLVGVSNQLDDKMLYWSLILPMELGSALFSDTNNNEHKIVQCNSMVALAWSLMNDCFLTNLDKHKINVVQSVVYSRGYNLTRINFNRFYTVIWEIGDEVISTASLRIHNPKLAEMPYIATGQKYRLQGMSRKLIIAIESVTLYSLNVENLVIPSIAELATMWIGKYRFSHVKDSLRGEILHSNMLMFPRTIRLQNTLLSAESVAPNNRSIKVVEENNNDSLQNVARLSNFDLNLEPRLFVLNQEPEM
ncbi:LOW QUALITY PROTEIN: hypothetical protein CFOL_v3_31133, partial [Cephalotus follicularis]